jgi:hypothetical protein
MRFHLVAGECPCDILKRALILAEREIHAILPDPRHMHGAGPSLSRAWRALLFLRTADER